MAGELLCAAETGSSGCVKSCIGIPGLYVRIRNQRRSLCGTNSRITSCVCKFAESKERIHVDLFEYNRGTFFLS
jgi:hypothetical protein